MKERKKEKSCRDRSINVKQTPAFIHRKITQHHELKFLKNFIFSRDKTRELVKPLLWEQRTFASS